MKPCRRCGEVKPLDKFYEHPQMADGHLNVCTACICAQTKARREANIERVRAYDRQRGQSPERKAANRKRYRKDIADPEKRARIREQASAWAERNAQKHQAHMIVRNAIKAGTLKVQPCERCGFALGVQAHHEDYSKPLEVVWLCKTHHGERHREINEEKRRAA